MARKTSDGVLVRKILRAAEDLGITIRNGKKHPHILNYPGMRACPIAKSTNARTMVAPWMAQVYNCSSIEAYNRIVNY